MTEHTTDDTGKRGERVREALHQVREDMLALRRDVLSAAFEERNLAQSEREGLIAALKDRIEEARSAVEGRTEQQVNDLLRERRQELEDRLAEAGKKADEIIERVERRLEPFRWLASASADEVDGLGDVTTVGVAHEAVARLFLEGNREMAMRAARRVVDEDLPGTVEDFHNLAAELALCDHEATAAEVLARGLARHPENVDLLAESVRLSACLGDLTRAADLFERLEALPRERWTWRAFVSGGAYLEAAGRVEDALKLYAEFRTQSPEDERGYARPADWHLRHGRTDDAVSLLEEAVAACRRGAECSLMLARTYTARGEYERAIQAASRCIESCADEEPAADEAAALWQRALAADAWAHRAVQDASSAGNADGPDRDWLARTVRNAVSDYAAVTRIAERSSPLAARVPARLAALRSLLQRLDAQEEQIRWVFRDAGWMPGSEIE